MKRILGMLIISTLILCGCNSNNNSSSNSVENHKSADSANSEPVNEARKINSIDELTDKEKEYYNLILDQLPILVDSIGGECTVSSPVYNYNVDNNEMFETPVFFAIVDGEIVSQIGINDKNNDVFLNSPVDKQYSKLLKEQKPFAAFEGNIVINSAENYYGLYYDDNYYTYGLGADTFDQKKIDTAKMKMQYIIDLGQVITKK